MPGLYSKNGSPNEPRQKPAKRWITPSPTGAASPASAASRRRWKPEECRAFFSRRTIPRAVECPNCGHLDAHLAAACVACGHPTRELANVHDAIIPIVIRRDIELFYLKDHADLDRAGNIAALLRFRSDQTTGQVAAAS